MGIIYKIEDWTGKLSISHLFSILLPHPDGNTEMDKTATYLSFTNEAMEM